MHLSRVPNCLLIIILVFLSFGPYFNSLHGDFLIDDEPGILNNPRIHNWHVFFQPPFNLRPGFLVDFVHLVLWRVSAYNTFYFHLFSVLVHTGCTVLLFILCNLLFQNKALSFLSSLIFALQPIHTEAVSWISGLPYALSSLFFLAALIFYLRIEKSLFNLFWLTVFFSLCFFSGNSASTLPVLLVCYELFFRKDRQKKSRKLRFLVLALTILLAFLLTLLSFYGRNQFTHLIFRFRGFNYLIVIVKALLYYLKILYLPLARGLYHPFAFNTTDIQRISPAFFASLLVCLLAIFSFFKFRRRFPQLSFGIAWFFINYAPYSNIIPVCNIISERYLYLPSAGFAIFTAALFLKAWQLINLQALYRKYLRIVALCAATLYLSSYAVLTLRRNMEYSDVFNYWNSNINNFSDGYFVYNNLAATFYAMGNFENAKSYCWINLLINPAQAHVWCNLGKLYRETKDLGMAKSCYQEALKINPDYFPALQGLRIIEGAQREKGKKE